MAATQVPLTNTAWTDLGAGPLYVELEDSREAIIQVSAANPGAGVKWGTRLSFTPPRDMGKDIGFATKVWARAETDKGASVIVQKA